MASHNNKRFRRPPDLHCLSSMEVSMMGNMRTDLQIPGAATKHLCAHYTTNPGRYSHFISESSVPLTGCKVGNIFDKGLFSDIAMF